MTRYRSSRNLGQIANRPHGSETLGARAPFSSFTLPQTGQRGGRRQLSEQAVISRTEPYNLDRSTLAELHRTSPEVEPDTFRFADPPTILDQTVGIVPPSMM